MRILPIGKDRFHRNYWYFENSPNNGIFIEDVFIIYFNIYNILTFFRLNTIVNIIK